MTWIYGAVGSVWLKGGSVKSARETLATVLCKLLNPGAAGSQNELSQNLHTNERCVCFHLEQFNMWLFFFFFGCRIWDLVTSLFVCFCDLKITVYAAALYLHCIVMYAAFVDLHYPHCA